MAVAAIALALSRDAAASCVWLPVCEQYWHADAVFVGTVTDIRCGVSAYEPSGPPGDEVHFAVDEAFRGVMGTTATVREWVCGQVVTSASAGFIKGETYFVQALRVPGSDLLQTSACATQPVARAAAALEYARWIRTQPRAGRVSGHIVHVQWDPEGDGERSFSLPSDLVVTLRSAEGVVRRVAPQWTGLSPTFLFEDVPPGSYEVNVETGGPYAALVPVHVTIRRPQLCGEADFNIQWKGVVRGRVLDADGQPVPHCPVGAMSRQRARDGSVFGRHEQFATNEDGEFVHETLGPGEYVVGVHVDNEARQREIPAYYFPGVGDSRLAQVVSVAVGSETDLGDLYLPVRVEKVPMSGQVVMPDGSPATGIEVRFRSDHQSYDLPEMTTRADAYGVFLIYGVRGRRYTVSAYAQEQHRPLSASIDVTAGLNLSLTLHLRPDD